MSQSGGGGGELRVSLAGSLCLHRPKHPQPLVLLDPPMKQRYQRVFGMQKEFIPQCRSLPPDPHKKIESPYTQPVGLGETPVSKELLLFVILIIALPVGILERREKPLQKH